MSWMEYAACVVELPDIDLITDDEEYKDAYEAALADTSFIRRPDGDLEERRWAKTCSRCEVFELCAAWADRLKVDGVYAAGLWREEERDG